MGKLYKHYFGCHQITVGDKVKIGEEIVIVHQIVKVVFSSRLMYFYGIPYTEIN